METCSTSKTDQKLVELLLFFEKTNFFNFYGIFKFQIFLKFFQIFVKNDEKYEQTRNWFLEQNNHARTTKTSLRPKTDQKWQFHQGVLTKVDFFKFFKKFEILELFWNFWKFRNFLNFLTIFWYKILCQMSKSRYFFKFFSPLFLSRLKLQNELSGTSVAPLARPRRSKT